MEYHKGEGEAGLTVKLLIVGADPLQKDCVEPPPPVGAAGVVFTVTYVVPIALTHPFKVAVTV